MKFDEHQARVQQQELSPPGFLRLDGVSIMGAGGFARALRVACQRAGHQGSRFYSVQQNTTE